MLRKCTCDACKEKIPAICIKNIQLIVQEVYWICFNQIKPTENHWILGADSKHTDIGQWDGYEFLTFYRCCTPFPITHWAEIPRIPECKKNE